MDIQYLNSIGIVPAPSAAPELPGAATSSSAAAEVFGLTGRALHLDVTPSEAAFQFLPATALSNFVFLNELDALCMGRDGLLPVFVRLGHAGFALKVHERVQEGTIALSRLHRLFLATNPGASVVVQALEQPPKLKACCFEVRCLEGGFEGCVGEVLWTVKEQLEGHVIIEDQRFSVHCKGVHLELTAVRGCGATCGPAVLCSTTLVELRQGDGMTLRNFPHLTSQGKDAPLRLQVRADELGALQGEYWLYSLDLSVNHRLLWRQCKGNGWIYFGLDGFWVLNSQFNALWGDAQDVVLEPSDRDVLRSRSRAAGQQPHEGTWQLRKEGQWVEVKKDRVCVVCLQHQPRSWASPVASVSQRPSAAAGSSSLPQGQPSASSSMHQPTDPSATAEFVQSMHEAGMTNWVLHRGHAINLEDPADTADLDADTLDRLIHEACHTTETQQPHRPLVPLHPWEVEKLTSLASQVSSALRGGRYGKDFGEILLSQLGGWWGDEDWARVESQRIISLVQVDDADSREELLRWVDDSLVQSLREITKEANRGQLAGVMPTGASGSSSQQATAAPGEARGSSQPREDKLEELELQQALRASLEEGDLYAFPDSDSDCDSNGCGDNELASPEPASVEPVTPCFCRHRCDLGSSCCKCIVRALRPGVVPGLVSWWQDRGMALPPLGPSGRDLRFLCTACSGRGPLVVGERWPLPFGGEALLGNAARVEELVLPRSSEGDSLDFNDASEWEDGSWVAVDAAGVGEAASEASWVLS